MKRRNPQTGFTLTELLVVMGIVAILLSIGVPSYKYVTNSYRMSAEVNSLLGDLQQARSEALKGGLWVVVCTSSTGTSCSGSSSWQNGWIVFQDVNHNGQVDGNERIFKVQAAFTGSTPDTFVTNDGISAVTYNREGYATSAAGFATSEFTLKDPTQNNAWTRCLFLNPVGMATTKSDAQTPGAC
jgi:type IV fimbrial biogenesis protein FimT